MGLHTEGQYISIFGFGPLTDCSQTSLRQAMSVSRAEIRASVNGAYQTSEESRQRHKPRPSNARSHLKGTKALLKKGGPLTPSKSRAQTGSMSLTRGLVRRHHGADPLTIEGNGGTSGKQVTVEIPAPSSTSHCSPTNDAASVTSSHGTPMASFCRDQSYRHLFEEDLQLFATSLIHRERKRVLSHQETTQALTIIESRCTRAIDHFMRTKSFNYITIQNLKESTFELGRLLVAGEQPEEIREGLEVLSSHVKISTTSFLVSFAAASIMQWIYLDFYPQLPDIGQNLGWSLLNSVLESKWLTALSDEPSQRS